MTEKYAMIDHLVLAPQIIGQEIQIIYVCVLIPKWALKAYNDQRTSPLLMVLSTGIQCVDRIKMHVASKQKETLI